jgi:hypothetical protein
VARLSHECVTRYPIILLYGAQSDRRMSVIPGTCLSPEALLRPWVREELRAAYVRRAAGELKILPILFQDCEIPPFLADYEYADFRDDRRYGEQVALLERSIKKAVKQARKKA